MKKFFLFAVLLIGVLELSAAAPKYIFLFIGDGMSAPQRMVAEEFHQAAVADARKKSPEGGKETPADKEAGKLLFNHFPYQGTTRTCSANALITDSAAAATAIACGEKTSNGRIGMNVAGDKNLESVAYVARKAGYKVGIITSVTINHATPAGFYAHRRSRSDGYGIGLDLINSGFDLFAGGGFDGAANDTKNKNYAGNLYELAAKAGYTVINGGKEKFMALTPAPGQRVLYTAGDKALPYSIDSGIAVGGKTSNRPQLSEIVKKSIELLDNPNGFFMMVEGGSIDWVGHANDAAANLREVIALDEAVRVAAAFMAKHPGETLIVTTGDHETGGLTMGMGGMGYGLNLRVLAKQKCSAGVFASLAKDKMVAAGTADFKFDDVKPMLTEYFGFVFGEGKEVMVLRKSEVKELENAFAAGKKDKNPGMTPLANAAKKIISNKAGVGWSSGSHTALPVLTTAAGAGAERFTGFYENTDISLKLKDLLTGK